MLYHKKRKTRLKSFFTAADLIKSKKLNFKMPPNVIMLPNSSANEYVQGLSKKRFALLGGAAADIISPRLAIISNFGLGAPLTAALADMAACLGGRNFVISGIAGGLSAQLKIADTVLCSGAFCDDGTSPNYIAEDFAPADKSLLARLAAALPHELKAYTWTTDAIFRETKQEVLFYAKQGAAVVEMEASALFALALKRGLKAAGVFVISDLLAPAAWQHEPNPKNYNKVMEGNLKKMTEIFR